MTTIKLDVTNNEELVTRRALEFRKRYEEMKLDRTINPREIQERTWELDTLNSVIKKLDEKVDEEIKWMMEKYP